MNDLQTLMDFIAKQYIFSERSYPKLKTPITDEEKRVFVLNHSILHMLKSQGRLASCVERYDHGLSFDEAIVRTTTVKMLINTLKLADEIGMSAQDLAEELVEVMVPTKSEQDESFYWFKKLLPPK